MGQTRAKAISKFVRVTPRKARLVADLIRGLPVDEAEIQLNFSQMRAGKLLQKTLASAVANAETNHEARRDMLHVVEVRVDEGPYMKRAKARARGARSPILKKTSHLTVVVSEKGEE